MNATTPERVAAFFKMDATELRAAYCELFGEEPRSRSRTWLAKHCAAKVQQDNQPALPPPRRVSALRPGVVLVRVWHGAEQRVTVLDDGFAWQGRPYKSLSAVANAITGQHWSGALFFGLRGRSRKR